MSYARERCVSTLLIEPMSCLAEPPTLPDEIVSMGDELVAYQAANPERTSPADFCVDIAHGHRDEAGVLGHDNAALFHATLPYLRAMHLKNNDAHDVGERAVVLV